MKRFSYMVGGLGNSWDVASVEAQLNECGQRGWELVAVITRTLNAHPCTFYYFRKEIGEHDTREDNARVPWEDKKKSA
jgi:hypothetical protein